MNNIKSMKVFRLVMGTLFLVFVIETFYTYHTILELHQILLGSLINNFDLDDKYNPDGSPKLEITRG